MDDEVKKINGFLQLILPDPLVASKLAAELAQVCANDFTRDPWSTLWELLQDYGYALSLPWHTPPEEGVAGFRTLWENAGLPPADFPAMPATSPDAEHLVWAVSLLLQRHQLTLSYLYEDSDYVVLVLIRTAAFAQAQRAATAAGGQLNAI